MLGRIFRKKETDHEEASDDSSRRPRFRRTKSAASQSVYADYESDDWGDAATIHVDRHGNPVRMGSENDSLEDWQRGQPGIIARMRSLSLSRPNFTRAPPAAYGWAARVERAGGFDETQRRRDEERSRRPVTMPVPNPAPAPIDVRGDADFRVLGEAPATLARQSTDSSHPPRGRILDDRSGTSSPKVIEHKDIHKKGPQDMIGSLKPGQLGAYTRPRHLSRVEKIAAVIQHVASLPFISDSPVNTYYPAKEKEVIPPVEPYRAFDPTIPKRYLPPPPMPPCWYQPKPPKPKKAKEPKKAKDSKELKNPELIGGIPIADDRGFPLGPSDNQFNYPNYDDYDDDYYSDDPRNWEGDTPTLQSDLPTTEESESYYDQPRMISDIDYTTLPVRPAFFPAPIKSTGLSTAPNNPTAYHGPLQIADTPYYDDDYSSTEYSYEPIPSPLTTTYDPRISRVPSQYTRAPLAITYPVPPPESSSAMTVPGPPLLIPSPTGHSRVAPTPGARLGPLPGGYSPAEQPFAKHYDAYLPPKGGKRRSPKVANGPSPRSKPGPSPQVLYEPSPYGFGPPLRPPSNMKIGPSPRAASGVSPQPPYGPPPPATRGPSPGTSYGPSPGVAYGFPYKPSPQTAWGPSPQAPYGMPPKGPSPQAPYGFPTHAPYGPSPQAPYDPPPQVAYDPRMYGPPIQDLPPQPYAFYAGTGTPTYIDPIKEQYVWGWGARKIGPDGLPLPPPIPGESPPPIPSPIATVTSIARSRASRRG
ncbi:unnamed protein product [Rhizoctonia solani]|uniref:Uncharacterized protein n=1 Tax=Rhizoctonia solani TaxID=456999 RepID=A0A8H3BFY5_9AGAM|nr:unnamed protein product [Rhizoctonia solani]